MNELGRLFSVIYRKGQQYLAGELKALGVSAGEAPFLLLLEEHRGMSQQKLAESLEMDKALVARVIKKLEVRGMVSRQRRREDQREFVVELTGQGKEEVARIKPPFQKWTSAMTSGLSRQERETLVSLLQKVEKNVCDE